MRIELKNIRKYFGNVKANDSISLTFEGGKIYGLLGENGAGKSTLMKILSGYQSQDSGEILLNDQEVKFNSPAEALKHGIGMLYQEPLDFPPFKITEDFLLGYNNDFFLDQKSIRKTLNEYAHKYDFILNPDAYVDTLSLGERQQLELIRLLASGAQVLILDEPTTGISAAQKDVLFSSMRKLAHDEGKILILVSHKLDEVQELCDHAFILRKGKFVGESEIPCPTENLVKMMFGEVPIRNIRKRSVRDETTITLDHIFIETYRLDVNDINLEIKTSEVFGLAGLEGGGQQLLLQTIAGLIKPAKGKIILEGKDITGLSYHEKQKAGISYISAGRLEGGLVAGLTITEHIILVQPKKSFFIDWNSSRQLASERIQRYQIVGEPNTLVDTLSGGNQQRLLFALLNSPLKLLLLEHPTRGLDVQSANWIWELLYERRKNGTAILFMSSDLDEIIERSDRIAVFSGGKMSRIVDAEHTSVDELGHLIGGQE